MCQIEAASNSWREAGGQWVPLATAQFRLQVTKPCGRGGQKGVRLIEQAKLRQ